MNQQSNAQSDFSTSQVPKSATFSGWHIALVVVGGTISIPGFLMAADIGANLGLANAARAFAIGCVILGTLAALTGLAGQKSGLSAYMLGEFAFGRWGGKVASLAIALSLIGWFGVISNIFAQAADLLGNAVLGIDLPVEVYVVVGSFLIIWVTVSGFKGIDKLALALVPVMFAFLILAASMAYEDVADWQASGSRNMGLATAISAVVGSYIAGVTIQPDYSRFARSRIGALSSAFVALGISFPIVLFCTAIPSVAMSEPDLFKVMFALGIGVPAFLLLSLASWSSNVLNVYSASLSLSTIFKRLDLRTIVIGIGVIGTALAFARAQDYLTQYLVLLGITIPPISSIYVIEALIFRRRFDEAALSGRPRIVYSAFVAWILAIVVGFLTLRGVWSITKIAALDSILVAMLASVTLRFVETQIAQRLPTPSTDQGTGLER